MKTALLILSFLVWIIPVSAGHVFVVISEQTVNDFLAAVGPVKGKGKKQGVSYKWKVKHVEFDFEPGSAMFKSVVDLDAGVFKLSDNVQSRVNVLYDGETNMIKMEVEKAIFNIYIKVFGNKIKVGKIDIARYYKPKFEFNGPQPVQEMIEMQTAKDKTRTIAVAVTKQELTIEKDQIRVAVDLSYSGVDNP